MTVDPGEVVALIGSNGAGKSSLLGAVSGVVSTWGGSVRYGERALTGFEPDRIVRAGVLQVPQGRRLFGSLTVEENLRMGAYLRNDREVDADLERMLKLLPRLRERYGYLAGRLSGGEQQQVAIARALMARPQVLLIDEMSLGLAPVLVDQHRREAERHLVDQQHLRARHQRARDRDLLLLAAREPAGEVAVPFAQPRQQLQHPLEIGVDLAVVAQVRAHPQVLFDRERAEQPPPLRHLQHARAHDAIGFEPGQRPFTVANAAAPRRDDTADGAEQRRFPGAVGADQRHDLAGVDGHRDVPQDLRVAVAGAQGVDDERARRDRRLR